MKKFLIITDLDASFIDEKYEYRLAIDAVERIKDLGVPLVFNSSKTLSECEFLAHELNLKTPMIAENGGVVSVPAGSELTAYCMSAGGENWHDEQGSMHLITGLSRGFILEQAHRLRDENEYDFEGFSDWSSQKLSDMTGLSIDAASLAKRRHVSEPILWNDTEERWLKFKAEMSEYEIRTLRGGKFVHLMGPSDKADGLRVVKGLYEKQSPDLDWVTVALGDSANDKSMLEEADIGIVIPHEGGPRIKPDGGHIIYASDLSSRGWNDSVLDLLTSH